MIDLSHIPEASGIYRLRHFFTGDEYIGSAANMRSRVARHIQLITDRRHQSVRVAGAFTSGDAVVADVLEACDFSQLADRERHWIKQRKPSLNERGGGGGCRKKQSNKIGIFASVDGDLWNEVLAACANPNDRVHFERPPSQVVHMALALHMSQFRAAKRKPTPPKKKGAK